MMYKVRGFTILLFLLLAFLNGCESTHIEDIDAGEIKNEDVQYKMLYIHMNDSTIIDVTNKYPRYKKSYKGVKNVILYDYSIEVARYIKIENISKIVVQRKQSDVPQTILAILGTVGGILVLLFIIALSSVSGH